eukprot:2526144-Rhodomonas_salina.2
MCIRDRSQYHAPPRSIRYPSTTHRLGPYARRERGEGLGGKRRLEEGIVAGAPLPVADSGSTYGVLVRTSQQHTCQY